MSVESEILRIQHNIANTYTAVAEKGGDVPLQPNSANLAAAVETIPSAGLDVYSTEETRAGTWLDGKPIYKRTWGTTTGNAKEWVVVSESSNVDLLVRAECVILYKGDDEQAVGPSATIHMWHINSLRMWVNDTTIAQKPAYATYWYTKKDDSLDVNGNPLS